jgi:L-gulonolactone oxidase
MPFERYFRAVHALAEEHAGGAARPHWGKRHLHDAPSLAPRYPGWDAFAALRAELDPRGVFTNAHVAHVLGPVGAGRR